MQNLTNTMKYEKPKRWRKKRKTELYSELQIRGCIYTLRKNKRIKKKKSEEENETPFVTYSFRLYEYVSVGLKYNWMFQQEQ